MRIEAERMQDETDVETRACVALLKRGPWARTASGFTDSVLAAVRAERSRRSRLGFSRVFGRPRTMALAAGVAVLLAAWGVWMRIPVTSDVRGLVACQRADGTFSATSAAPYVQAFAVAVLAQRPQEHAQALDAAVGALVREQDAEGGWANADLSARNVAALRRAATAGVAGAQRAYKRGVRYLRMHGIGEITVEDLVREAQRDAARLGVAADRGLTHCLRLCAGHSSI